MSSPLSKWTKLDKGYSLSAHVHNAYLRSRAMGEILPLSVAGELRLSRPDALPVVRAGELRVSKDRTLAEIGEILSSKTARRSVTASSLNEATSPALAEELSPNCRRTGLSNFPSFFPSRVCVDRLKGRSSLVCGWMLAVHCAGVCTSRGPVVTSGDAACPFAGVFFAGGSPMSFDEAFLTFW